MFARRGLLESADDRRGHCYFWLIAFYTIKSHRAVGSLEQMLEPTGEVESDLDVRGNSDGNGLQVEIVF